jgi:DNA processing protein
MPSANNSEKFYQVALTLIEGLGSILTKNLVSHCGSAQQVFQWPAAKLLKIPGIGEHLVAKIVAKDSFAAAEKVFAEVEKHQAQLIFYTDPSYPQRLKALYDAPPLLYYRGTQDLQFTRSVSIVGTRKATEYGKKITEQIVEGLAGHQVVIVSGLAYGIDIVAHRTALKVGLPTVGVMANSVEMVYPPTHEKTAQQMLQQGALISESPFGTGPDAPRFVARNRIIAGLSDVIVVVESAAKGGGLITAKYGNNYHREVFAVPGDLHNKYSEGCNALLRNNEAQIFTGINDILEARNWDAAVEAAPALQWDMSLFTNDESQVIALLRRQGDLPIDELAWQSQLSMSTLASLLLSLEFQGVVRSMPGKRYALAYLS